MGSLLATETELLIHADHLRIHRDPPIISGSQLYRLDTPYFKGTSHAFALHLDQRSLELLSFHVTLYTADLVLSGQRLLFNDSSGLLVMNRGELFLDDLSSVAIRFHRGECQGKHCRFTHVESALCPHQPSTLLLSAEDVTLHPSQDVDLRHVTLKIGAAELSAFPWLRLRPRDKPGFLAPNLGYSPTGGWLLGPAGYLPVSKNVYFEGRIIARTFQGFETHTDFHTPHTNISLDHLHNAPRNHARLGVRSALQLDRAALNLDVDIVNKDRTIIDELARHPLDRALSHTSSRGLLALGLEHAVLETDFLFVQPLQTAIDSGPVLTPMFTVALQIPALPLNPYLLPALELGLTRYGIFGTPPYLDALNRVRTRSYTSVWFSPRVSATRRLALFELILSGAARYQTWLVDRTATDPPEVHGVAMAAGLRLPLFRAFRRLRHDIAPFLRYRLSHGTSSATSLPIMRRQDLVSTGHGIEVGLTTQLKSAKASLASIDVYERIRLPGFNASSRLAYIATRAKLGPPVLFLALDGAWDQRRDHLPSFMGATLTSQTDTAGKFSLGARWIGTGDGPHVSGPIDTTAPLRNLSTWPIDTVSTLETNADIHTRITQTINLLGGMRLGLWPKRRIHTIWYGIRLSTRCGCLSISILASHRLDTAIPDIMTAFNVRGG